VTRDLPSFDSACLCKELSKHPCGKVAAAHHSPQCLFFFPVSLSHFEDDETADGKETPARTAVTTLVKKQCDAEVVLAFSVLTVAQV
jgi:hypothetical protein